MEISTTAQPGSSGQRTPTPLGICKPSFILLSWSTSNAPRYQVFFGIRRGQRNCAFKLGPHVAASLRTEAFPDGMSAFLLPAHIIVRNARGFEKTLSQRRAAEVHVSVLKAGSKTRRCVWKVLAGPLELVSCSCSQSLSFRLSSHFGTSGKVYAFTTDTLALFYTQLCTSDALTNSPRDRVISCPHPLKQFEWVRAETNVEILH